MLVVLALVGEQRRARGLARCPGAIAEGQPEDVARQKALAAADALADFDGAVVVLSGDSPLIRPETIREMCALREEHDAAVVVLTMELANPFGYGRIVRDERIRR